MNRLFLLLLLTASNLWASTTFLDCNVKGSILSSFENKNLRESRVTVEIQEEKAFLSIIVEGEDDYIASASTVKHPIGHVINLSTDSKYDLTSTWYPESGKIKSSTNKILINRLSGHLSVSKALEFRDGVAFYTSYSGNCSKVTGKKF